MVAMNFPANPVDQQVYGDYIYDAPNTMWRSAVMVGAAPCGSIMPFAGANIPAGWLLCDGSAVSRTTYSSLFAALGGISSPWGLGNGTTTFNLPDLRTRVPVGKSASGTFASLGAIGGAETMSLQEAHLASHFHYYSATTSWNGDHNHAPPVSVVWNGNASQDRRIMTTNYGLWSGGDWYNAVTTNGAHNHTISGNTDSRGSGQAFGLLQPYAVVNYIIKFSAVVAATDTEIATRMGQAESTVTSQATTISGYNARVTALENELAKTSFAQINKTTLQAFGSGFMTIQFNEILFAKNIQLVGNLIRFAHAGVYRITVGMRIANDAGDSWTGMSLYNATAGRVGISYGTGNVAGDPGPMEFTFLANVTNTSVDYAIQLYRAGSVLTQLTPDANAGKAIAATVERIGAI